MLFGRKQSESSNEKANETMSLEQLQERFLNSLTLYRLNADLKINGEHIKSHEPVDLTSKKGIDKMWNKRVVNKRKAKSSNKLSVQRKYILDQISAFKAEGKSFDEEWAQNAEKLHQVFCTELFPSDVSNMAKNLFALRFALDNTYKFVYGDQTLEHVSNALFNDNHHIAKLLNSFSGHYAEIATEQFKNVEKGILIGLGVASVAATVLMPTSLAIGASVSGNIRQVLANVGHKGTQVFLPGIIRFTAITMLESLLVCGLGVGVCKILDKTERSKHYREAREMSVTDFNVIFAIKATLIEFARANLDDEQFKEAVSDSLTMLDDLRADAEYMMIVEKIDAPSARKKIKSCNALADRLATIVGI